MLRTLFVSVAISVFGLAAAHAQEAAPKAEEPICVNSGNVYQVGDMACIAACHGQRQLARCDQVADATKWTQVSDVCPSAMILDATRLAHWSRVPDPMSPIPGERPSLL